MAETATPGTPARGQFGLLALVQGAVTSVPAVIDDSAASYGMVFQQKRAIGTIIPDVTFEEQHRDELVITDHPVETGAAVSDHAFKMPVEVDMRVGFSDSTAQTLGYVESVYQEFIALQVQREPFNVSTGKRMYQNMLIRSLETTTDERSPFALYLTVGLREVIIVNTDLSGSAPQSAQAIPQQTSPVTNKGTVTFVHSPSANDFSTTQRAAGSPP